MKDCERCKNVAICKLEKPKDKCAFVNPFSESEDKPNCEECAGCTNWLCDCANVRDKVIDDFYSKVLNFEDYIEPVKIDGTVQLYSGKDMTDMIVKIKKELSEVLS